LGRHEHFEKLAALSAKGELDASQTQELELHLTTCVSCRRAYEAYGELHAPLRYALDPELVAVIESRRESVKARVLGGLALAQVGPAIHPRPDVEHACPPMAWRKFRVLGSGLVAGAALVVVFWLGMRTERSMLYARSRTLRTNHVEVIPSTPGPSGTKQDEAERQSFEQRYAQATTELRTEKQHGALLEASIGSKNHQLSESEQQRLLLEQQLDAEKGELERNRSLLDTKSEQVKQMEAARASDANTLVALRYEVENLTDKLNDQTHAVDREKQLLASGRDIRDIIGARNLHIIDVYDTDPEGNTKKSFARAFYTEGKSLIFYAYDLPAHRTDEGKYVYAAWGEQNGDKKNVRHLGILLNDDKGQKRWVLNFSDPKVLSEIDSVFITLERVGVDGGEPSGKRMLTAYLDSRVNHP
jgi:hypothetical protein